MLGRALEDVWRRDDGDRHSPALVLLDGAGVDGRGAEVAVGGVDAAAVDRRGRVRDRAGADVTLALLEIARGIRTIAKVERLLRRAVRLLGVTRSRGGQKSRECECDRRKPSGERRDCRHVMLVL